MNSTKPVVKAKPLVIGKETIKRIKVKSGMKAGRTLTSICSMCTP